MASLSESQKEQKPANRSERTCASCRKHDEPSALIRWVRSDEGEVFPDLAGRAFGRGAWTHSHLSCLKDLQKSLQRSFRAPVVTSTSDALELLAQAGSHRVSLLLGAARRQNFLVFGNDATAEAWNRGDVFLLLVARDARAAASASYIGAAVEKGAVRAWGTKCEFGRLFGRSEVGVVGVRDRGLARSLFGAIAMALPIQEEPLPGSSGSGI